MNKVFQYKDSDQWLLSKFWEAVDDLNVLHIITAHKQGNVFRGVCDSVHRGVPTPGGGLRGVPGPGGFLVLGVSGLGGPAPGGSGLGEGCLVETSQMATAAGSLHPTGMHSCLIGKL